MAQFAGDGQPRLEMGPRLLHLTPLKVQNAEEIEAGGLAASVAKLAGDGQRPVVVGPRLLNPTLVMVQVPEPFTMLLSAASGRPARGVCQAPPRNERAFSIPALVRGA